MLGNLVDVTDLQRRKFDRLFIVLDADQDGAVAESDYKEVARRMVDAIGGQDVSEVGELFATIWSEFQAPYDADNSGTLDRGEFRGSLVSAVVTHPDRVLQLMGNVTNLLFGIVDTDGDGRITRGEHVRLGCEAFRVDRADAELSFDKVDTAGNGFITAEGYLRAVTEFFTSPLPGAPGNWFFGPF